nr:hypothetical protein CFP56_32251 [Quercus suber]
MGMQWIGPTDERMTRVREPQTDISLLAHPGGHESVVLSQFLRRIELSLASLHALNAAAYLCRCSIYQFVLVDSPPPSLETSDVTIMFAAKSLRRFVPAPTTPRVTVAARQFQTSSRSAFANKHSQDKDSMKIESNEYSKSGSDQAAAQDGAAFDPSTTKPESEGAEAAKTATTIVTDGTEQSKNALNVSPDNPEVSKPKTGSDQESGSPRQTGQGATDRSATSGGGSPKKSG